MIFWIILGVAIGYFFKKQIDGLLKKAILHFRKKDYLEDDDKY